ncbi:hypothetical protein GBA52_014178 [Prunus armeniaca]|nr:hypothetical protein GBA52_014178 [Prunus armeniaca]
MTFSSSHGHFPKKTTSGHNGKRPSRYHLSHLSPQKKKQHGPIVCFTMEFRPRNYSAEKQAHALPRVRADDHPLSAPSSLPHLQVGVADHGDTEFFDPLRRSDNNAEAAREDLVDIETSSGAGLSSEASIQNPSKEWASFKRSLVQRFPVSKTVSTSSMSDVMVKGRKTYEKSSTSMHLEELDDPEKFAEEGGKVITGQEYVSRLHELKAELTRAWHADDRVTSLKISIKVARLLMDTSVLQCYPTLFALATDILDMLGICFDWFTAENFSASDVCSDAKETCKNWFCKIGAVRELLPRIYLELALLPCWRFLVDQPLDSLRRLVMMTRGLADPLASAYCRLYMSHCMRKLPSLDTGCLLTCANDFKIVLMRVISAEETSHGNLSDNKRLLVGLMEPTIEFIMKCIFKNMSERQVGDVLVELGLGDNQVELFGRFPYVSIVLHHLLKQLPSEVVSSRAVEILRLIELSNDDSFDQVIVQYDGLDEYLKVADAYVDIILQNHMDDHLNSILEGISKRACSEEIADDEMATLQSILVKLLSYYKDLEDIFSMVCFSLIIFLKILDLMYGSSRSIVNMHILDIGIRCLFSYFIFIFYFIYLMPHLTVIVPSERQTFSELQNFLKLLKLDFSFFFQLAFLVECRGSFGGIRGLKIRQLNLYLETAELLGNDVLFFGDSSYLHELASLCQFVLQNLVDAVQQEPSMSPLSSSILLFIFFSDAISYFKQSSHLNLSLGNRNKKNGRKRVGLMQRPLMQIFSLQSLLLMFVSGPRCKDHCLY